MLEEEVAICKINQKMLSKHGIDTVFTHEPDIAVELYNNAKSEGQPFEGVILDLSIDGETVATRVLECLKKINPDVKAIVSSGSLFDEIMVKYKQFGFQNALAKPFGKLELISAVRAMVDTG